MPSEKEYVNLITEDRALTPEEQKKVAHFEKFIEDANKHKGDITSLEVNAITHNYEEQMAFLDSLEAKTENTQNALNNYHDRLEEKEQERIKFNDALTLTRKKDAGYERRAGFTSATIIIFLVMLLGILLSVGLLVMV